MKKTAILITSAALLLLFNSCNGSEGKGTYAKVEEDRLVFGNSLLELSIPDDSWDGLAPCESAPYIGGKIVPYPGKWSKCTIESSCKDSTVISLEYPEWEAGGETVKLYKEIRIYSGSRKVRVSDMFFFDSRATMDFAQGFGVKEGHKSYLRRSMGVLQQGGKGYSVFSPHAYFSGYTADDKNIITAERAYSGSVITYLVEQRECADHAAWKAFKNEMNRYFDD